MGVSGVVPLTHVSNPEKPLTEAIPAQSLHVGSVLASELNLKEGLSVEFHGHPLTVQKIYPPRGTNSLWEQFGFDLRPAFAAAAGMLACGLVVYGVATSDGGPNLGSGLVGMSESAPGLLEPGRMLTSHSDGGNSTNVVPDYGTPIDRKGFGGQVLRVNHVMRH
jgi:hypothetical protein